MDDGKSKIYTRECNKRGEKEFGTHIWKLEKSVVTLLVRF